MINETIPTVIKFKYFADRSTCSLIRKLQKHATFDLHTNNLILALRRLGVPSQQNIANLRVIALAEPMEQ